MFEQFRGKLAANQALEYAKKNNPAYEAPDGKQFARNYKSNIVLQQRAATGRAYYSVRTKSAARLKGTTRRSMGFIGVAQSAWAALSSLDRAKVKQIWDSFTTKPAKSAQAWFFAVMKDALMYQQNELSFNNPIFPTITVTFDNPYSLGDSHAIEISTAVWLKFATMFSYGFNQSTATSGFYFTVDGKQFFAPLGGSGPLVWSAFLSDNTNENFAATKSGLTSQTTNVLFNGKQVYKDGVAIKTTETMSGGDYSTIRE